MKKFKLKELIEIKHGYSFKSENYVDNGQYRLVTLGNISEDNNFRHNNRNAVYYNKDVPEEYILNTDDLIMPLTEQVVGLLGNSAFIPASKDFKYVLNQRVGKVVIKHDDLDYKYLHYLLASRFVKEQLEARASGTKQRNISPSDVYDTEVYIPNLHQQRDIGLLLYKIENVINNNDIITRRLNQILNTLFSYYFLQFDFPDKNGNPYKSSGYKMVYNNQLKMKIPEGWAVKTVGDIIIEKPKSKIQINHVCNNDGKIPFFTSGEDILKVNKPLVSGKHLFLSTGGNSHISFYDGEAAYSTDTWCLSTKDNLEVYFYQ